MQQSRVSCAVERYMNCNSENAMRMASSEGDPAHLAIEAEASCIRERLALELGCIKTQLGTDQARVLLDGMDGRELRAMRQPSLWMASASFGPFQPQTNTNR